MRYTILISTCCLLGLAHSAVAQQQQVVQLPTIGTFSVNTSVLVPDRGSAYLGGNLSGSSFSGQRGTWPAASSRSSRMSANGVSVSATIIDLREMDRAILQSSGGADALAKAGSTSPAYFAKLKVKGMSEADLEDVDYFLTHAQGARRQGRWEGMDVFLQLAKAKIPADKQKEVLAHYGFVAKVEPKSESNRNR